MKKIAAFFATRPNFNMNTANERKRLSRAMPGEVGSLAALRLTGMGL